MQINVTRTELGLIVAALHELACRVTDENFEWLAAVDEGILPKLNSKSTELWNLYFKLKDMA